MIGVRSLGCGVATLARFAFLRAPAPWKRAVSPGHLRSFIHSSIASRAARCRMTPARLTCRRDCADCAAASAAEVGPAEVEFDWELAASLAACSFEAYAGIERKGLTEKTRDGAEVVYTDADFLREKLSGVLRVSVLRAEGLDAATDAPGDPYCVVSLGDDSYSTTTAERGPEPRWEEQGGTGTLFVRDATRQRLSVRLLTSDNAAPLGVALRGVDDLADEQRREEGLELRGQCGRGTVWVSLRFMPFTDASFEDSQSEMGGTVLGTPGSALMPDNWRRLERKMLRAGLPRFAHFAFVESEMTSTQLWCSWNREQRQLVVAFRGTEQSQWKDILTDISLSPINLSSNRVADAPRRAPLAEVSSPPSPISKVLATVEQAKREVAAKREVEQREAAESEAATEGGDGGTAQGGALGRAAGKGEDKSVVAAAVDAVMATASDLQEVLRRVREAVDADEEGRGPPADEAWVHSGFLSAYDSVRAEVLGLIDTALAGEQEPWTVLLTGHSLGGALATLCAYDLALRRWSQRPSLVLYNFGSPRAGNKTFATEFNARVPHTWRVVNSDDAVCTVPRLMGYCHVGHAVVLKKGGEFEVQRDTTEAPHEGTAAAEVLPAVGAAVSAAMASAVPQVMRSAGMEIAAVASGSGSVDAPQDADADEVAAETDDLTSLWEAEKAAWSLLLGGRGLEPHMEHLYFESLDAAVDRVLAAEEGRLHGADAAAT